MNKKLLSCLLIIFCTCLLNGCNYRNELTTVHGVVYVLENIERETQSYSNDRYLPLLEITQQFEDFHEKSILSWKNPYDEEKERIHLEVLEEINNEDERELIDLITTHVVNLLQHKETIDEYLTYMTTQRECTLAFRWHLIRELLLGNETVLTKLFPNNKKFLKKLMHNCSLFSEKHRLHNEKTRLQTVTRFELLTKLIQKAVELTDPESLSLSSKDLLRQVDLKENYADALGGPYALLGDILGIEDGRLDRKQIKHLIKLKKLIDFDQLMRTEGSPNFFFVSKLFKNLYHSTDPAVNHCILQLVRHRNIKVVWKNPILLKLLDQQSLEYKTDKLDNIYISSPIPSCSCGGDLNKQILKKTKEERLEANSSSIPSTPNHQEVRRTKQEWLTYIEGSTSKNKRIKKGKKNPPPIPANQTRKGSLVTKKDKTYNKAGALVSDASNPAVKTETSQIPKSTLPKASPANTDAQQRQRSITPEQKTDITEPVSEPEPTELEPTTRKNNFISTIVNILYPDNNDNPKAKTASMEDVPPPINSSSKERFPLPIPIPNNDQPKPPLLRSASFTERTRGKSIPVSRPVSPLALNKVVPSIPKGNPTPKSLREDKGAGAKNKKITGPTTEQGRKEPYEKKQETKQDIVVSEKAFKTVAKEDQAEKAEDISIFTIPSGLRSFHHQMLVKAYPVRLYSKHQHLVEQLFDPYSQCNITYKDFKTLWEGNGGFITSHGGSHRGLQYPQGVNLFGIYAPHAKDARYGKKSVRYLQVATLYIGLRPTNGLNQC